MSSSRNGNRITRALCASCLALGLVSTPHAQQTGIRQLPPEERRAGIWISSEEIQGLPTSGRAWKALLEAADRPVIAPSIADRNSNDDTAVMAKALVYVRTGQSRDRKSVV